MANEFFIQPAGQGVGTKLAGLGTIIAAGREKKAQKEAEDLKRQEMEAAQAEIQNAIQSGDYGAVADVSIRYPGFRENIESAMGFTDQMRDQQRMEEKSFLQDLVTSPSTAIERTQQHIQSILDRGGDPRNSVMLLEELSNPDTQMQALKDAKTKFAVSYPDEFKAYQAATEEEKPDYQRVSALVRGEEEPTTLLFDPATGEFSRQLAAGGEEKIPSELVTQISVQGARGDVLPPNKTDDLVARKDWLEYQQQDIGRMLEKVRADPSLVGVPGSIRRLGQTISGSAQDLASMFGEAGAQDASDYIMGATNMAIDAVESGAMTEAQFNKLFNDPTLSELRLFENSLGFTLAQLRAPDQRMLSTVINRSLDDAKLTGLTSSQDVINRLESIYEQFDSRIDSLNRRLGIESAPREGEWEIVR